MVGLLLVDFTGLGTAAQGGIGGNIGYCRSFDSSSFVEVAKNFTISYEIFTLRLYDFEIEAGY